MVNRVMQQKAFKMRRYRMKGAKKVFPSNYNNTVKVSQGPDLRMAEYYQRAKGLGEEFTDRLRIDDPILQMELKRLHQGDRMQKIHEFYNLRVNGQERRLTYYFFGGGEHFFIRDLGSKRQLSVSYKTREQAMFYYDNNMIQWERTDAVQPTSQ